MRNRNEYIKHKENIGKKFNRLTIIDVIKINNKYMYKCKCDCGTIKNIATWHVLRNDIKSCGCLLKEIGKIKAKEMGQKNRKYKECYFCHSQKHYAKGLCKNCYCRLLRNGTLEYLRNKEK